MTDKEIYLANAKKKIDKSLEAQRDYLNNARRKFPNKGESFADIKPDAAKYWSDINIMSPYDVMPGINVKFIFSRDFMVCTTPLNKIPVGSWKPLELGLSSNIPFDKSLQAKGGSHLEFWSVDNVETPYQVGARSGKKYKFDYITESGFKYSMTRALIEVTENPNTLPHQSSRPPLITGLNDLETLYPEVASEWDYDSNTGLPSETSPGSNKRVSWKCYRNHHWSTSVNNRTRLSTNCPACAGQMSDESNNITVTHPEVVDIWDYELNNLPPEKFMSGSGHKAHFVCVLGHRYSTIIRDKLTRNSDHQIAPCPYCSGKRVLPGFNDLAAKNPELATEWHPTKNGDLLPTQVSPFSSKKVWWVGGCGHSWESAVHNRTYGKGCPRCNHGYTSEHLLEFLTGLGDLTDRLSSADLRVLFMLANIPLSSSSGLVNSIVRKKISVSDAIDALEDAIDSDDESVIDDNLPEEEESTDIDDVIEDPRGDDTLDTPVLTVLEDIDKIDSKVGVSKSTDEEQVEYFTHRFLGSLWRAVCLGQDVLDVVEKWEGDGYLHTLIRDRFMHEYQEAVSMEVPVDWPYPFQPTLMQRLVAYRMSVDMRLGNWSGTGSGKTASAVLANLWAGSPETLVVCPNSVVDQWVKETRGNGLNQFHIVNFDKLSSAKSVKEINDLIKTKGVEMLVVDELHLAKTRSEDEEGFSIRRKTLMGIATTLKDGYFLGMTATPVINNLREAISILELVEGISLEHMGTTVSLDNISEIYSRFIRKGIRFMPEYKEMDLILVEDIIETDGLFVGRRDTLQFEQIALEQKMDSIVNYAKDGGIIYCHYVEGIIEPIAERLNQEGITFGFFTGEDKSGLEPYKRGEIDVLIGSSAISTGVDGLQHRHSRIIMASLPWTDAHFEQIVGRVYRQGNKGDVTIYIPQTSEWCSQRLALIQSKRTLARAVVDGNLPSAGMTNDQVDEALKAIRERLSKGVSGATYEIKPLDVDLEELIAQMNPKDYVRTTSDFSDVNRRWNSQLSSTTRENLLKDTTDWDDYHTLYAAARKSWSFVPKDYFETELRGRSKGKVVADLGCGRDYISADQHEIHRFDHIAADDSVTSADISNVPLPDNSMDISILSLALMGSNWRDYIREAVRITDQDGFVWIAETVTHAEKWGLREFLDSEGLSVVEWNQMDSFIIARLAVRSS